MGKKKVCRPEATVTRPLKKHLDRVSAIMAEHAEVALSAAEDDIERAARIFADRLTADPAFSGEVDEMTRMNADPTSNCFDADLDHALHSMFSDS